MLAWDALLAQPVRLTNHSHECSAYRLNRNYRVRRLNGRSLLTPTTTRKDCALRGKRSSCEWPPPSCQSHTCWLRRHAMQIFNLHGDSPCRVSRTGVRISLRKVSSCHTLMAQYWTVQSGTEVKLLQRHFPSLIQHLLLEEEAAFERCAMYQQ